MITLQQFVDKYNGKLVDFDGKYSGQCVDLYRQYVKEVLELPQTPPVVGAKDIWTGVTNGFEKIANTPTGVPSVGDIMIWGSKYGPYGHVAIVTSADINRFTCFSQNDPSGTLCGYKNYLTYGPTLGWLHPIPAITDPHLAEIVKLNEKITALENSQKDLSFRLAQLESLIATKDEQIATVTQEVTLLTEEKQKALADVEYYKPYKSLYENKLKETIDKYTGKQLIALGIKKLLNKNAK